MEKTARRPSTDPAQEKLRQNKANWNKEVSALVNDLIHLKKMMNGWPSKFFKERTRITEPIPADPATIIGSLAGDFQELVNRGNGIIQEQLDYSKNRRKKQPKAPVAPAQPGAPATPATPTPEAPKTPNLSQQLNQGLAASVGEAMLIKLASDFEGKYFLESEASNPFSRFITRLFNPKFGFGEAARIRRLRMTMLDNCVKSFKSLKQLRNEIVKSSSNSIVISHKMMTLIWNYWNIVNRLFSTYKTIKPGVVKEEGGKIEDPELKRMRDMEEGRDPDAPEGTPDQIDKSKLSKLTSLIQDFRAAAPSIKSNSPAFRELGALVEAIMAAPKNSKGEVLARSNFGQLYTDALREVSTELGVVGSSFQEIAKNIKLDGVNNKTAQLQSFLGKTRHQIIPGRTSGSRLEVHQLIDQIMRNLDIVMNVLEEGFDQTKLTTAISQVNRDMSSLRTMIRSLYYSEKPEEASNSFF